MTSFQKQMIEHNAKVISSFIALHCEPTGWCAWHEGECGNEVEKLFGTRDIPTAFTAEAPARMVADEIIRLNPGIPVTTLR